MYIPGSPSLRYDSSMPTSTVHAGGAPQPAANAPRHEAPHGPAHHDPADLHTHMADAGAWHLRQLLEQQQMQAMLGEWRDDDPQDVEGPEPPCEPNEAQAPEDPEGPEEPAAADARPRSLTQEDVVEILGRPENQGESGLTRYEISMAFDGVQVESRRHIVDKAARPHGAVELVPDSKPQRFRLKLRPGDPVRPAEQPRRIREEDVIEILRRDKHHGDKGLSVKQICKAFGVSATPTRHGEILKYANRDSSIEIVRGSKPPRLRLNGEPTAALDRAVKARTDLEEIRRYAGRPVIAGALPALIHTIFSTKAKDGATTEEFRAHIAKERDVSRSDFIRAMAREVREMNECEADFAILTPADTHDSKYRRVLRADMPAVDRRPKIVGIGASVCPATPRPVLPGDDVAGQSQQTARHGPQGHGGSNADLWSLNVMLEQQRRQLAEIGEPVGQEPANLQELRHYAGRAILPHGAPALIHALFSGPCPNGGTGDELFEHRPADCKITREAFISALGKEGREMDQWGSEWSLVLPRAGGQGKYLRVRRAEAEALRRAALSAPPERVPPGTELRRSDRLKRPSEEDCSAQPAAKRGPGEFHAEGPFAAHEASHDFGDDHARLPQQMRGVAHFAPPLTELSAFDQAHQALWLASQAPLSIGPLHALNPHADLESGNLHFAPLPHTGHGAGDDLADLMEWIDGGA